MIFFMTSIERRNLYGEQKKAFTLSRGVLGVDASERIRKRFAYEFTVHRLHKVGRWGLYLVGYSETKAALAESGVLTRLSLEDITRLLLHTGKESTGEQLKLP